MRDGRRMGSVAGRDRGSAHEAAAGLGAAAAPSTILILARGPPHGVGGRAGSLWAAVEGSGARGPKVWRAERAAAA
jgi:hypothetical protein